MGECLIAFLGYFCARHVRAQPHGAAVKYINVPDVLIQESIVNMHVYEQLVSVELVYSELMCYTHTLFKADFSTLKPKKSSESDQTLHIMRVLSGGQDLIKWLPIALVAISK